ncbi:Do/DeqQ family serine protease [Tangfeifania diversioriginum]|uniref:Do/DeqQ family serine protease n=1 Tax=Tangfeifania diversioriginum TaxID=1168035 RepID=A0A1M6LZ01_9BACT|nr:Do family serine endopeptidase [Tangfeifania diversioriginum]SHJ76424.1 Do/DeqQ family serine protease [Tangfeifania diversioriginum]
MKNTRKYALTFLLAVASAFLAVWIYSSFFAKSEVVTIKEEQPVRFAAYSDGDASLPDLTYAAEKSVHSVVHIATQSVRGGGWSTGNPLFDEFFGFRQQEPQIARGFGSGVIISDDGYIVTNNHVIERAQKIKVILNDKREFEARLVGADPSTDIALLKIEAEDLPFLTYGNSDNLKIGEWVLAVGNPFNLTSTVTAGIVSARARNLGINAEELSIESFIQTDAAVNRGNSGGALVNQQGNLVGINTAIASRTGSYAGYSFAVPVSIVKKVVEDLVEFGEVQRALLGVRIGDVTAAVAEEYDLDKVEGVFVGEVTESGAARDAGIKSGDVIISVASERVNSSAELQEKISRYRPGDDVEIGIKRNGDRKQFTVTLRNKHGDTQIVRDNITVLGARFDEVSTREKRNLDIENGIKIIKLEDGKLKDAGLEENFIITHVNKKPIYEVNDLKREIGNARGGILVEGIYPNGELAYYVFGVD